MAKAQTQYICQNCGTVSSKWSGKCDACNAWNSFAEENVAVSPFGSKKQSTRGTRALEVVDLSFEEGVRDYPRYITGLNEFDRALGDGLVPGCAVLIGGDPGIGKSTILLQVAARLAQKGVACLYVSGEEAVDQVRLRAQRLRLSKAPLGLAASTDVRDIIAAIEVKSNPPSLVIIDFHSNDVFGQCRKCSRNGDAGAGLYHMNLFGQPRKIIVVLFWWDTSRRRGRLLDLVFWNTWWIRFCISKGIADISSGFWRTC
jgi:predicted ATP-dependent serine protease